MRYKYITAFTFSNDRIKRISKIKSYLNISYKIRYIILYIKNNN